MYIAEQGLKMAFNNTIHVTSDLPLKRALYTCLKTIRIFHKNLVESQIKDFFVFKLNRNFRGETLPGLIRSLKNLTYRWKQIGFSYVKTTRIKVGSKLLVRT